jgi:hypothetical protein
VCTLKIINICIGYSTLLIDAVQQHAKQQGCSLVEIDIINVREELHKFYDKHGFKEVSTIPWTGVGTYLACSYDNIVFTLSVMVHRKQTSIWLSCTKFCNYSNLPPNKGLFSLRLDIKYKLIISDISSYVIAFFDLSLQNHHREWVQYISLNNLKE